MQTEPSEKGENPKLPEAQKVNYGSTTHTVPVLYKS